MAALAAGAEHDVVVIGSGAAGLVAALAASDAGASVGVYEKSRFIGGTTAISGGMVWIAANPHEAEIGVRDSVEDGVRYLMSLSHGLLDERLVRVLVQSGPEVVGWLERRTPLRLRPIAGYPDYQPEHPGGMPEGGRSLECPLFAFADLGDWAERIVSPARAVNVMLHELPMGGGSGVIPEQTLQRRRARDERGIGQAIIGALLAGCLQRSIEPVTGARALELVRDGDRVGGVRMRLARDGSVREVRARRGVVLATGGFERDPQLVRSFLRGPMTAPTGVESNEGDGLKMAMRLGASLGNMREAWWVPVMYAPADSGEPMALLVNRERTLPRSIIVNRAGRRFVNEAANYNALGGAFHAFDAGRFDYPNLPCWLLFDHEYLRRYGIGSLGPCEQAPEWLLSAPSLGELAGELDLDGASLSATVARFNADVAAGRDGCFARGDSAYDLWAGDRSEQGHARTLGPLQVAPFHAIELHPGCLGTSGGPRTDERAKVIDVDEEVIPGLYAAGNVMAAPTGMAYGGAGGTLGPAMVFGYIAGGNCARGR